MSMPLVAKLNEEKLAFIHEKLEQGIKATVISRAYQRRFGNPLPPQEIESLRGFKPQPKRADVQAIKDKLGDHNEELEWVRAKLKARIDDDSITNAELVNLAREYRSNVVSSQQIATMNDETGNAQYVLVYGDTVKQSSPDAVDVDFTILEDD